MLNQNDDEVYEEIKYLFNEQIKKAKKEYASVIHQIIAQEEVVEYKFNYCEVNCEYEEVQKVDCIKSKPYLVDDEHRQVEIVKTIEEKKD